MVEGIFIVNRKQAEEVLLLRLTARFTAIYLAAIYLKAGDIAGR